MTQLSILHSLCDGLVMYVKSNEQQICPNSSICHTLPFYSKNVTFFFVSDTTFVFMKDEHKLENNVVITGASLIEFISLFAILWSIIVDMLLQRNMVQLFLSIILLKECFYSDMNIQYITKLDIYCTFSDVKGLFQNKTFNISGDNLYGGLF